MSRFYEAEAFSGSISTASLVLALAATTSPTGHGCSCQYLFRSCYQETTVTLVRARFSNHIQRPLVEGVCVYSSVLCY